jgi:hypothetical protein
MHRTGVDGSLVPSRDCVRPRELLGETSSIRITEGLVSPCAPVGVRLRSLFIPNGRGKVNPSLVGVPALLPLMVSETEEFDCFLASRFDYDSTLVGSE